MKAMKSALKRILPAKIVKLIQAIKYPLTYTSALSELMDYVKRPVP